MTYPIWKDYLVDLGTGDSVLYRIKLGVDGDIIYTGRSYKRPGETKNTIKINEICADYLQNVLPSLTHAEFSALEFPIEFIIENFISTAPGEDPDWELAGFVTFINDWSYDYNYDPSTMGMAFPINGRMDRRQYLIYTAYDASEVTATMHYKDGTTSFITIPIALTDDFDDSFNEDFARMLRAAGSGSVVLELSNYDGLSSVEINGKTYEVIDPCNRYALYYVNAYGGWDSLLIEGNTKETDQLTRQIRSVEYDNRNITNRGTENYLNEIEKTLVLNTSWMDDDQSLRMHNLLNSPCVYLYDMELNQMIPVILKNQSTEYKTYKNNSRQLISYSIEMSIAHNRVRR